MNRPVWERPLQIVSALVGSTCGWLAVNQSYEQAVQHEPWRQVERAWLPLALGIPLGATLGWLFGSAVTKTELTPGKTVSTAILATLGYIAVGIFLTRLGVIQLSVRVLVVMLIATLSLKLEFGKGSTLAFQALGGACMSVGFVLGLLSLRNFGDLFIWAFGGAMLFVLGGALWLVGRVNRTT